MACFFSVSVDNGKRFMKICTLSDIIFYAVTLVVLSAGGVTVTLHFSEHVSINSVLFYKNSWIRSLCLLKRPEISHCRDVDEAIRFPFQRQFRKEK